MDADVIVVGAGPVGLFLAAELELAGADALVLERRETPSEETKARGLGALATEALRRRGLGDQLAEADVEGTKDLARDHGSTLGHFASIHKIVPDPGRPRTNIWQPELERVLAKHAEGVRVLRGHEVTALESDVDGVTVTAGGRKWRAKYLVGCDGGRSTVRKLAGFAFPGTPALLQRQARCTANISGTPSTIHCARADTSIPRWHSQHSAGSQAAPIAVVTHRLPAAPDAPNSSSVYRPVSADWLLMTSSWATVTTQPVNHPACGPNARAAQVKLVPQSGSAVFSSRKATATNSTGTNDSHHSGVRVAEPPARGGAPDVTAGRTRPP